MKISEIAVQNPISTIMFFAAIVMLGLVSLDRLPLQVLPDISPPYGAVVCRVNQQMSMDEMERKIIKPIEGEIAQLPNVKNIFYHGGNHFSFFPIQFEYGTNVKYRIVDLQERLTKIRKTFEKNAIFLNAFAFDTAWVNKDFMDLVLKGPRDDLFIERIDAERYRQKLQDINGVASADIWGGRKRTVDVTIFQDQLREFGVPLWQVMSRIQSYANEPIFLGDIEEGPNKYFVRLNGQFANSDEISDVVVRPEGNIAVRHLGDVEETFRQRRWLGRMDGKPALRIGLQKEALENPIELSKRTKVVVAAINKELPEGYELGVVWEQADEITNVLSTLSELGLVGILLSMTVLYLFIRNVRMALILCLVIPITIAATFNCMYFSNMSINIISLLGLVIGIGCLIDSSVVVLENIFRHHEKGKNAYSSAIIGSKEVGLAVFALTLTNVIVFLPIVFVEGEIRLIFTEGALAIVFPIVISMMVALTLVPMATSKVFYLMDRHKSLQLLHLYNLGYSESDALTHLASQKSKWEIFSRILMKIPHPRMALLRRKYGTILKSCLRHRVRFLIGIVLIILYTVYYTSTEINRDSLSMAEDEDSFYIYVYLPNGTNQTYTVEVISRIEDQLAKLVPEAKHVNSWVSDDFAQLRIDLIDIKKRAKESATIKEGLRTWMETFGEAELSFNQIRTRSENQQPVMDNGQRGSIEIRGPEYAQITDIAENFSEYLKEQILDIRDAEPQSEHGALEVIFRLDREKCAYLQVDAYQVSRSIQNAQRRSEYSTIQMKKGDQEIDIVFAQFETPSERKKKSGNDGDFGIQFEELKKVPVYSPLLRTTLSLEEIGSFDVQRGLGSVQRENRERIGRIMFDTAPNAKFIEVEEQIKTIIANYPTPAGYRMTLGGKSKRVNEELEAFKTIIYLAVILTYMCIASLFESFSLPIVIMLAIPLAIIGVVWAFILTGTQFNPLAILGCVFLVGMLPNSSILLIHFAGFLRREKIYPRERAIMVSGYTRLRPIFMTVATTILALLPMAIPRKGNNEWVPFAVTVIGGLASSTILTLLIVPGFYFIVEDVSNLFSRAIRFCTSYRWVFVFWSKKRRLALKEKLTAYRTFPVREEPLLIKLDHLTRIYSPTRIEIVYSYIKDRLQWKRSASALGIVPASIAEQPVKKSTKSRKKALDMVSLEIHQGLFGLLGPNGAGKTTLLRLLSGIDQPTRGFLSICGYDMKFEAKKAQGLIGYLPQYFGVYSHMNALQYLEYFALLKGMKIKSERDEAIQKALAMVNLTDQATVPVCQFSGGMMRRIGLAQIFVKPPKVLIVDEPTVGLDPMERVRFRNMLSKLSQDRVVILSTHIVEDVAHSCKQVALMNDGRIIMVGSPDDLVASIDGLVWETVVSQAEDWREYRKRCQVVSQSQMEEGIRIRIIADTKPDASAVPVDPNLEDAYLYHTHFKNRTH